MAIYFEGEDTTTKPINTSSFALTERLAPYFRAFPLCHTIMSLQFEKLTKDTNTDRRDRSYLDS